MNYGQLVIEITSSIFEGMPVILILALTFDYLGKMWFK